MVVVVVAVTVVVVVVLVLLRLSHKLRFLKYVSNKRTCGTRPAKVVQLQVCERRVEGVERGRALLSRLMIMLIVIVIVIVVVGHRFIQCREVSLPDFGEPKLSEGRPNWFMRHACETVCRCLQKGKSKQAITVNTSHTTQKFCLAAKGKDECLVSEESAHFACSHTPIEANDACRSNNNYNNTGDDDDDERTSHCPLSLSNSPNRSNGSLSIAASPFKPILVSRGRRRPFTV